MIVLALGGNGTVTAPTVLAIFPPETAHAASTEA